MVRGRGLDGLLRELVLRVGLRARWLNGLGPGGVLLGLGGGSVRFGGSCCGFWFWLGLFGCGDSALGRTGIGLGLRCPFEV